MEVPSLRSWATTSGGPSGVRDRTECGHRYRDNLRAYFAVRTFYQKDKQRPSPLMSQLGRAPKEVAVNITVLKMGCKLAVVARVLGSWVCCC